MNTIKFFLGSILVLFLASCIPPPPPPTVLPVQDIPTQSSASPPVNPGTSPTSPTATPFIAIFNGYFNCRFEPNTSSPLVVLLQGQPVTLLARNREGWLNVTTQDTQTPCWVFSAEIIALNSLDITLIPFYDEYVSYTFTALVSPSSVTGSNGSSENPTITSRPPDPRPTDTNTPKPHPTSTPDFPHKECNDGADNDHDGFTDLADSGCQNRGDNSE